MIGPRSMDSRPNIASMNRNLSTKRLISRYESLTGARASSRQAPTLAPAVSTPSLSDKDRKPSVRLSFRNLVGLFKKGDSKFKLNSVFQRSRPSLSPSQQSSPRPQPPTMLNTEAIMTGTALYMARVSNTAASNSILPVWTTCTVTLQASQLVVSSVSLNGHPDTNAISLHDCTDVRSLTTNQLDPNELALIPKDHDLDDLRFFELLFDGRPSEKFAATSVHERADWVSAIWNVVLSISQAKSQHPHQLPQSPIIALPASPEPEIMDEAPRLSWGPPPASKSTIIRRSIDLAAANDGKSRPLSALFPDLGLSTPCASRLSALSVDKPLPTPGDWSATGSIINAYNDMPQMPEASRAESPLTSRDSQRLSQTFDDLSQGLAQGFETMRRGMDEVNARIDRTDVALMKMSQNVTELTRRPVTNASIPSTDPSQVDHISNSVLTLQIISRELRSLVDALEEKRSNESPPEQQDHKPQLQAALGQDTEAPILEKLGSINVGIASTSAEIHEITAMLKDETEQRITQGQQQAESVRYLNELNSWLESFVNNGASQIQGMNGSVEKIRATLGCEVDAAGQFNNPSIASVLLDIKVSIEALAVAVHETASGSRPGSAITADQIAELIGRQSQNHDAMFRGLGAELTSEIRGERIRFVDAMKEATEINVRAHVEEFKKELKREVHAMTKEIGKLYKERQTVENQISELFAFYSKQKQGLLPITTAPMQYPAQHGPPGQDPYQRRPLPSPQQRPGY